MSAIEGRIFTEESTLLFYIKIGVNAMKKATTSDGYFRETFTFEGKRYSVRAKTERELWRKVDEKQRQLASGTLVTNENTPVSKWFADYLETYKKPRVTPKTMHQLKAYVENYINPAIGTMRMKDVRPTALQKIMNSCAGQSTSQVVKLRDLIRAAFRQARIDRILIYDPSEGITMPDTTSGTHRPLTAQERFYIGITARHHRAGLWVLFMLYTGARPDETRKALWSDIDVQRQRITLHSSKTDYGDRVVPLHPALAQRLANGGEGYLFTQPTTGKPHTVTSMRQMWKSFKRAMDIDMGAQTYKGSVLPETSVVADDLTPYCLRHTYATDLQTAGVPINVAKDLLGHKTITMTAQVYTHLSESAITDAMNKITALHHEERKRKVVSL